MTDTAWFPTVPGPAGFVVCPPDKWAMMSATMPELAERMRAMGRQLAGLEFSAAVRRAEQFRVDWGGVPPDFIPVWRTRPKPDRPADPDPDAVWIDVERADPPVCPTLPPKWQLWDRRQWRAEFSVPRPLVPEATRVPATC